MKQEIGLTKEDLDIYRDRMSDTLAVMTRDSYRESQSITGSLPETAALAGVKVAKLVTNRTNNQADASDAGQFYIDALSAGTAEALGPAYWRAQAQISDRRFTDDKRAAAREFLPALTLRFQTAIESEMVR